MTTRICPGYATPPGRIIADWMAARDMSLGEFAARCGMPAGTVSKIVDGCMPLDADAAIRIEKVTSMTARLLLNMEVSYRLKIARDAELAESRAHAAWTKAFPIGRLVAWGYIKKPDSAADAVKKLSGFLGIAKPEALEMKLGRNGSASRNPSSLNDRDISLIIWLRMGELLAEREMHPGYNARKFKKSLAEIRSLTAKGLEKSLPGALELCNDAGVTLAFIKSPPRTNVSGAAWWLSSKSPVIQMSTSHQTDDRLWFNFFHEAAHILLHGDRLGGTMNAFVDGMDRDENEMEAEADMWAMNFLIKQAAWNKFTSGFKNSEKEVRQFARQQGIAPGVIVGRLQQERHSPWKHLNHLRQKPDWSKANPVLQMGFRGPV